VDVDVNVCSAGTVSVPRGHGIIVDSGGVHKQTFIMTTSRSLLTRRDGEVDLACHRMHSEVHQGPKPAGSGSMRSIKGLSCSLNERKSLEQVQCYFY
jgi:hypothetical protein